MTCGFRLCASVLVALLGCTSVDPPPAMHGGDPLDVLAPAGAALPAVEPELPLAPVRRHAAAPAAPPSSAEHRERPSAPPTAPPPTAPGYTCPMHADVRQDGPGDCPKCGMALVPASKP